MAQLKPKIQTINEKIPHPRGDSQERIADKLLLLSQNYGENEVTLFHSSSTTEEIDEKSEKNSMELHFANAGQKKKRTAYHLLKKQKSNPNENESTVANVSAQGMTSSQDNTKIMYGKTHASHLKSMERCVLENQGDELFHIMMVSFLCLFCFVRRVFLSEFEL